MNFKFADENNMYADKCKLLEMVLKYLKQVQSYHTDDARKVPLFVISNSLGSANLQMYCKIRSMSETHMHWLIFMWICNFKLCNQFTEKRRN